MESLISGVLPNKCLLRAAPYRDGTPPNPSTIDVMVGSPSKKQMRVRDMLQSFGNLFLVRLVIYYEFERVWPGHYSGNPKMLKFECA